MEAPVGKRMNRASIHKLLVARLLLVLVLWVLMRLRKRQCLSSCCKSEQEKVERGSLGVTWSAPRRPNGVIFAWQCHASLLGPQVQIEALKHTRTLSLPPTRPQLTLVQSCYGTKPTSTHGPGGESAVNWHGSQTQTHKHTHTNTSTHFWKENTQAKPVFCWPWRIPRPGRTRTLILSCLWRWGITRVWSWWS